MKRFFAMITQNLHLVCEGMLLCLHGCT